MNDDLEPRLRDGLQRGALPAAPDALRRTLAQLPAQRRGTWIARLRSGLRWTALASATALALVLVLVIRSLPGPPSAGPAGSATGSAGTSTVPSASPSEEPSAGAIIGPSVEPSAEPSAGPSGPAVRPSTEPTPSPTEAIAPPTGGFTCSSTSVLSGTTSAVVQVSDVRLGTHAGYDRIVFEFAGPGRPQLKLAVAVPPFTRDASGTPFDVPGKAFLILRLYDASGYPTYTGPTTFSPKYPRLMSLVNMGDYEGYVSWVAGLTGPACYRVSTLTSPTRIAIDIQAP